MFFCTFIANSLLSGEGEGLGNERYVGAWQTKICYVFYMFTFEGRGAKRRVSATFYHLFLVLPTQIFTFLHPVGGAGG